MTKTEINAGKIRITGADIKSVRNGVGAINAIAKTLGTDGLMEMVICGICDGCGVASELVGDVNDTDEIISKRLTDLGWEINGNANDYCPKCVASR